MRILKNIFKSKKEPIHSYADFWTWFQKHEKEFFNVVKNGKNIEKGFFNELSEKLEELKDGYLFLTGMYDDHTVELVFTADGDTNNIVFVEELVEAAPVCLGWKFTCLKPAIDIKDFSIEMDGYTFNSDKLKFHPNELVDYPDEIDITIVHSDLTKENTEQISHGVYIFLDNYLGELDFLNNIDNLTIVGSSEAQNELVPIEKLKDYLTWRQKEFNEKYQGVRYNTENDTHSMLEADLESGNKLFAVINTALLNWDRKASHPWIAVLTLNYNGSNNNGLPKEADYKLLDVIEDEILQEMKDFDGYLNIGRQTAENEREIYFACRDFRKPSKVFYAIERKYSNKFEMEYSIYKDKYWQTFERFNSNRG